MLLIADNITTRNPQVNRLFRQLKASEWDPQSAAFQRLQEMGRRCEAVGAYAVEVNIQQHHDHPEVMEAAVKAIQEVTDCRLCLSSNNVDSIQAGLKACKGFPIVNYVSMETDRLNEVLPLAAKYGAEVVLLVSDPAAPSDAQEMLGKAAILIGAANEVGIPNDRILIDPGIIHITHDVGQRHIREVRELLGALPATFEPPVRSTCWLGNSSTGAPARLRPVIECGLLAVLATIGLSSVFMNTLHPENIRMLSLLRVLNNEEVYSDSNIEMKLV